jgi:hypothetical protein
MSGATSAAFAGKMISTSWLLRCSIEHAVRRPGYLTPPQSGALSHCGVRMIGVRAVPSTRMVQTYVDVAAATGRPGQVTLDDRVSGWLPNLRDGDHQQARRLSRVLLGRIDPAPEGGGCRWPTCSGAASKRTRRRCRFCRAVCRALWPEPERGRSPLGVAAAHVEHINTTNASPDSVAVGSDLDRWNPP